MSRDKVSACGNLARDHAATLQSAAHAHAALLLCALDQGLYGCAFVNADVVEMFDRVRVDSSFGRCA